MKIPFHCHQCGKESSKNQAEFNRHKIHFCGKECYKKSLDRLTDHQKERIKHFYQNPRTTKLESLAADLQVSRTRISMYARKLGLIPMSKPLGSWDDKEIKILRQNAHNDPVVIQDRLKKYGFHRSISGIVCKRKEMGLLRSLSGLTCEQLAQCMGVSCNYIARRIERGEIYARKRGVSKNPDCDPYYILEPDIKTWIVNNVNQIDFGKVDKYWFIDLLANVVMQSGRIAKPTWIKKDDDMMDDEMDDEK